MDPRNNCFFRLDGNTLTLGNGLFSRSFSGVGGASAEYVTPRSRSLPYFEVRATMTDGGERRYQLWDDISTVRIIGGADEPLLTVEGEHWILRSVKLNAFTDNRDTVVEEREQSFFRGGLFAPVEGDIFFLEDPETERAIMIISENPDWRGAVLKAPLRGSSQENTSTGIRFENGGYPIVLGFCERGGCDALCRDYLRHANSAGTLLAMSNTWGDRNGRSRICEEFIRREIEAAGEIGIDVMQIDDGWQAGNTIYPIQKDERGNQVFYDGYWDLNTERFPRGLSPLAQQAEALGIKLGLWFAPSSHDCFAKIERDKEALRRAYEEDGARFFKLDMYQAASRESTDKMLELLEAIYSFGDDVSVQMDITRYERLNYLCGREYGTVFAENRYTRGPHAYYPHRVLRNLWNISRYVPSNRFQFEMLNPDLYRDAYSDSDPFAPDLYSMDYLFSTVMLTNPLFWMELQFLGEKRRAELAPLFSVWKEHREALAACDVAPIGERPGGRSHTGFMITREGEPRYMLLFREVTPKDSAVYELPEAGLAPRLLMSNTETEVEAEGDRLRVKFSSPRGYAFIKLEK